MYTFGSKWHMNFILSSWLPTMRAQDLERYSHASLWLRSKNASDSCFGRNLCGSSRAGSFVKFSINEIMGDAFSATANPLVKQVTQ